MKNENLVCVQTKKSILCTCGNSTVENIYGFELCIVCNIFYCPQCTSAINKEDGKCTGCNNYAAIKSLIFELKIF